MPAAGWSTTPIRHSSSSWEATAAADSPECCSDQSVRRSYTRPKCRGSWPASRDEPIQGRRLRGCPESCGSCDDQQHYLGDEMKTFLMLLAAIRERHSRRATG